MKASNPSAYRPGTPLGGHPRSIATRPQSVAVRPPVLLSDLAAFARELNLSALDFSLLAAFVLCRPRSFVLAHPEQKLSLRQQKSLCRLIKRRAKHEPMAYLLGQREFYGRNFIIKPGVLVPRPETETIIDAVRQILANNLPRKNTKLDLIDLGTGSGVIAITLALEFPTLLKLTATDISASALACTQLNLKKFQLSSISLIKSKFFAARALRKKRFDIIVANLPYLDPTWSWLSPELSFEPKQALFAKAHGQKDIKTLLKLTPKHLKPAGFLVLEFDPCEQAELSQYAQKHGFKLICQNSAWVSVWQVASA